MPAAEALAVAAARRRLSAALLGPVTLTILKPVAAGTQPGVRAGFVTTREKQVVEFERRLHQAGISFQVLSQPYWYNNGDGFELLILSEAPNSAGSP